MFQRANCVVIVGAQWGDEGKGKIVDVLARDADVVVRYQGGANAGHTVVTDSGEFILHQIPSGILHDGVLCVIGNGVVIDPSTFEHELAELVERGVQLDGRLRVSDRAHIVLPYHKLMEHASEARQKIGTTKRGIGPSYEDKFGRRGLRVGDLRYPEFLKSRLLPRIEAVNGILEAEGSNERASLDEHLDLLAKFGEVVFPLVADTGRITHESLVAGKKVLLEGAQGALLDVDHGTYPYVTSSNTTAGGASVGAGIGPTAIDDVLGVVKAYTTRVGNGPLPTELSEDKAGRLRELGGEFGATTGRPRRCGWFDAVVLRYAVRVNGITRLAVTKLDVLDTFEELPVCVGYRLNGEPVDSLPGSVTEFDQLEPEYETLEGWQTTTSDIRKLDDLPVQARRYLDRMQELAEIPVEYVSVGSRREQIVSVKS